MCIRCSRFVVSTRTQQHFRRDSCGTTTRRHNDGMHTVHTKRTVCKRNATSVASLRIASEGSVLGTFSAGTSLSLCWCLHSEKRIHFVGSTPKMVTLLSWLILRNESQTWIHSIFDGNFESELYIVCSMVGSIEWHCCWRRRKPVHPQ